jgi:hypothetical protein
MATYLPSAQLRHTSPHNGPISRYLSREMSHLPVAMHISYYRSSTDAPWSIVEIRKQFTNTRILFQQIFPFQTARKHAEAKCVLQPNERTAVHHVHDTVYSDRMESGTCLVCMTPQSPCLVVTHSDTISELPFDYERSNTFFFQQDSTTAHGPYS